MKKILSDIGIKKLFFIHNAIEEQKNIEIATKNYNFLWVNRLIKERKSKWFIDSIKELKIPNNALLGIDLNNFNNDVVLSQDYIIKNKNKYIELYNFIDPQNFYLKSKFFVLPSDIVFVNNSLIEAMSYGVVPIISNVEGAEMIVENNVDGFIFNHTEKDFKEVIEKAFNLDKNKYEIMSKNAKEKIKTKFSHKIWCKKYLTMIKSITCME
jgi:glycosyltransferase involved in cell wall biosynthesis